MPQIVYVSFTPSKEAVAELDRNTCDSLAASQASGMRSTDISMSPCPICKGSTYIDQLKESLDLLINGCGKKGGGMLWINLVDSLWLSDNHAMNRKILDNLLFYCANARDEGDDQFSCGIISAKDTWLNLFGGLEATRYSNAAQLIYQHLDGKASMQDWVHGQSKFGSWETPFGKQYERYHTDEKDCKLSSEAYANFLPSWLEEHEV